MGRFCKSVININLFNKIDSPEIAYFLGYFWADGHIRLDRGKYTTCALEISRKDYLKVKDIFIKFGKWNTLTRTRKNLGINTTTRIYSSDKLLYKFLYDNDFHIKSNTTPSKILSKIPDNLKHYFFRGWFDGDGYIRMDNKGIQITFGGTNHQDWKDLKNICDKLDIFSKINRYQNNNGKWSVFSISSTRDVLIFGNYIYNNSEIDLIFLPRKRDVFLKIVKKSKSMKLIKKTLRDIDGNVILEDLSGKRFGMLMVVEESYRNIHNQRQWKCKCDCGNTIITEGHSIKCGDAKSCGCYMSVTARENARKRFKDMNTIHGESHTHFYEIWIRTNNVCKKKKYHIQNKWKDYLKFKLDNYEKYLSIKELNPNKNIYFIRKNKELGYVNGNCFFDISPQNKIRN